MKQYLKYFKVNPIKWKRISRILILIAIFIGTSVFSFYGIAFAMGKPNVGEQNFIEMYDNQDQLFYSSNNKQQGTYVTLNNVSLYFINSIISAEDQSFYHHLGFDLKGIARAAYNDIKDISLDHGASTITQQYARTIYLSNDKTWSRKIKEAFIAARFEMYLSKEQILEGYVNSIYFGHGVYGVENASKFFFNKSAKELTYSEATLLAGIPNAPSHFSPLINMENAKQRQMVVTNRLYEDGLITKEQKIEIDNEPIVLATENKLYDTSSVLYYKDSVLKELQDLGFSTSEYLNDGLRIYTNMNSTYQSYLEESAKEILAKNDENLQVSAILVEPFTSRVLGILGGRDYATSEFNRALYNERQIGSTMKPILYYLALENGFSPVTKMESEVTTFRLEDGTVFAPTNYNDQYAHDNVTLVNAIAVSDNIYAVKTHLFLGTEFLSNELQRFNIKGSEANPSLALGTVSTSIYHLANIYNTYASEGIHNEPYFIEKIVDADGNILYQHENENTQFLDRDTTLVLNQLLTSTMDSRTIGYSGPSLLNFLTKSTIAGKTGTTDWDSLVIGYNPNILCGVWVGYDDNTVLKNQGERDASRFIWKNTLNKITGNSDVWYQPSDNLIVMPINPISGEYDAKGSIYWFKNE